MADIIMLFPKTGEDIGATITPPFSVLCAASFAYREGYNISIIDQRVDRHWKASLSREIKKQKPLFIGISSMTGSQIHFGLNIAKYARTISDAPLVWGGVHPSILPVQTLKSEFVDIVVRGEGEETVLELADALSQGMPLHDIAGICYSNNDEIVQTIDRPLLDVNTLPDTPWELVEVGNYITTPLYLESGKRMLDIGETSRGCPIGCGFCCSSAIRHCKWRPMTAEKAAYKIINNVRKFKLDSIWIRDDNFFVDLKRNEEIFQIMIKEGVSVQWYTSGTRINTFNKMDSSFIHLMKKTGADVLKFGGESGSNRVLEFIGKRQTREHIVASNKKAMQYDIIPSYSFMGGFPTETTEDFMMTIDLMLQLKRDNPDAIIEGINMFTPFPGTKLFNVAVENGLVPPEHFAEWASWSFYNEAHMAWFTDEQKRMLKNACDICLYSGNLLKGLKTIKNPIQRTLFIAVFFPFIKYYQYKWNNKKFGYDPALKAIRLARKVFIDRSLKL